MRSEPSTPVLSRSSSMTSIPLADQDATIPNNGTYVELKKIDLDFEYKGKTYQIKFVNQKIGTGKEQSLDLSKLEPEEIEALKAQAQKTMAAMEQLSGRPEGLLGTSFTLHFTSTYNEPTFVNKAAALLRIERFQYKQDPFELDSITYKDASGKEQKFEVDLSRYSKKSQQRIRGELQPLNRVVQSAFNRTIYNAPPLEFGEKKAITPAKKQVQDMSQLVPVDEENLENRRVNLTSADDDLQSRLDALRQDD